MNCDSWQTGDGGKRHRFVEKVGMSCKDAALRGGIHPRQWITCSPVIGEERTVRRRTSTSLLPTNSSIPLFLLSLSLSHFSSFQAIVSTRLSGSLERNHDMVVDNRLIEKRRFLAEKMENVSIDLGYYRRTNPRIFVFQRIGRTKGFVAVISERERERGGGSSSSRLLEHVLSASRFTASSSRLNGGSPWNADDPPQPPRAKSFEGKIRVEKQTFISRNAVDGVGEFIGDRRLVDDSRLL